MGGVASINMDALEHMISQLSVVEDNLQSANKLVQRADSTIKYVGDMCRNPTMIVRPNRMSPYASADIDYLPAIVVGYLYQLPNTDPYSRWVETWGPKLRKALGLARLVAAAEPSFSSSAVPIDESFIDSAPKALTADEIATIGNKIKTGQSLSDAEWAALHADRSDPQTATSLMAIITSEQLAQYLGRDAYTSQPLPDGWDKHAEALSCLFAAWANRPGNQQQAADGICNSLTGKGIAWNDIQATAVGMSLLISFGSFNAETALQVAEYIYDWEQKPAGIALSNNDASGEGFCFRYPDGSVITDIVQSVLAMLGKSPEAATKFFTQGSEKNVTISVASGNGAGDRTVPINDRISWAANRNWPDDGGAAAGSALYVASVPLPATAGGPASKPTQEQTQVASQFAAVLASNQIQDPNQQAQKGIGAAAANVLAAYSFDGMQIVSGLGRHGDLGRGTPQVDDTWGLGIDTAIYGLAIQNISRDQANVEALAKGWLDALPGFITKYVFPARDDAAVQAFLSEGYDSSAAWILMKAATALDFIIDNAWAAWPNHQQTGLTAGLQAFGSTADDAIVSAVVALTDPFLGVVYTIGDITYQSFAAAQAAQADIIAERNTHQVAVDAGGVARSAAKVFMQTMADLGYIDADGTMGPEQRRVIEERVIGQAQGRISDVHIAERDQTDQTQWSGNRAIGQNF